MKVEAERPVTDVGGRAEPGRGIGRAEHHGTNAAWTKAEPALMEAAVERSNMQRAYQRVVRNKGAAGVDGLGVSELGDLLRQHWPTIKAKLLDGSYCPQPVRQVGIPKPNGGERMLGIPTVLDRLIQQALHQVLSPIFEPTFSEHSYGFRPGRNAHQAVRAAQQHVLGGHGWNGAIPRRMSWKHGCQLLSNGLTKSHFSGESKLCSASCGIQSVITPYTRANQ